MEQAQALQPSKSKSGWILLLIGWAFFFTPLPIVTTFIGGIFILIAMLIAVMQMQRKEGGLSLLLIAIFGSPIMWFVGFFVALSMFGR